MHKRARQNLVQELPEKTHILHCLDHERLWNLLICTTRIDHHAQSNWGINGDVPHRHDGEVDDLDMHNNGHVNNITKNGTCGISTVCTQTALNVPVSEHNGHVKLVQELHLWDLHGLVQGFQSTKTTMPKILGLPTNE